jgi:DNA-binding IclR family transcriptional regulator
MTTIKKALGLLEYFSSSKPEINLIEFRGLSGFDKGTVHRYLTSLRYAGFLEQNQKTRAYRLGPAIIRLAAVREQTFPIVKIIAPHVDHLADTTQELVHASLAQPQGMSALYYKDGGYSGTRVGFEESEILPFHATSSGISMMAFGPSRILEVEITQTFQKFTDTTPVTVDSVKTLIKEAQQKGYAATNQTFEDDVYSIAAPFFDADAAAIGTLAIATPSTRVDSSNCITLARLLVKTALSITQDLGGTITPKLAKMWDDL